MEVKAQLQEGDSFFGKGTTWPKGRRKLRGKRELTEKRTLQRGKTGKDRDK